MRAVELRFLSGAIKKKYEWIKSGENLVRPKISVDRRLKSEQLKEELPAFFGEVVFVFAICFAPSSWKNSGSSGLSNVHLFFPVGAQWVRRIIVIGNT